MKTKMMFGCFVVVSISLVFLTVDGSRLAWGQFHIDQPPRLDQPLRQSRDSHNNTRAYRVQQRGLSDDFSAGSFGRTGQRSQANNTDAEYRKAMKKLRAASSEEEKNGAKTELSTLFDRYFDADMKRREKNIVDLESRVQKLRAQFDKRQAAKDKILQLQLQVLSNEAEGLGFFSPSGRVSPSPWPHSQYIGVQPPSNDVPPRRAQSRYDPGDGVQPPSNDGPRPSWPSSPTSPPEPSSDSADRESRSR